jgi:hypothetical protein
MDKIKKLETKKLLKELEFVESDFDYKTLVLSECDVEFNNSVNKFLEGHPELKERFDSKISKEIDDAIKKQVDEIEESEKDEEEDEEYDEDDNEEVKSPKLKKLYRDIVKITHPDKVKNKKLNNHYIKATECYDKNDLAGIYFICDQVGVEYELEEEDNKLINGKIDTLKERIGFMESTFTWIWHNAKDDKEKEQLIMNYIRMQLSN